MLRNTNRTTGATLVEVLSAVALIAFSLSSLFVMYSTALRWVRSQQQTMAATLCLQHRCEQIRAANWSVITSAQRLRDQVLSTQTPGLVLPGLQQEITVSQYPAVAGSTPILVRRTGGSATIVSQPSSNTLVSSRAVRVDVRAAWTGNRRTRTREASMIVALGGAVR
jgi:type II secretory pathway pseudopilin PulG